MGLLIIRTKIRQIRTRQKAARRQRLPLKMTTKNRIPTRQKVAKNKREACSTDCSSFGLTNLSCWGKIVT